MSESSSSPSKASLYDILGVPSSASSSDIKKAYHRKARRCHPDKHQNDSAKTAEFQLISNAYNVLKDERKRKIYDQLGEEGVKVMEQGVSNVTPEMAFIMLSQTSKKQRAVMALIVCILLSFAWLFPIFFILRTDDTVHWNWSVVFIPVWIADAFGVLCCFSCLHGAFLSNSSASAGLTDEQEREHKRGTISFAFSFSSLLIQQVLLVMKLDGKLDSLHWNAVLAPWIVFELIILISFLCGGGAREDFYTFAQIPAAEKKRVTRTTDFWLFLFSNCLSNIARIAFVLTLSAKLENGSDSNWWTVFAPLWMAFALMIPVWLWRRRLVLRRADRLRADIEAGASNANGSTEEDGMHPGDSMGQIFASVIYHALLLLTLVLLVIRLQGASFSLVVVILPFAIPLSCICCCVGCFAMDLKGEEMNPEDNDGGSQNQPTERVHPEV